MEWYSTADSPFGSDVDAPPNGGLGLNVFLRGGDDVFQTWHTGGRGVEQLSQSFPLIGVLPWGRQEEWQDSPEGWPKEGPDRNLIPASRANGGESRCTLSARQCRYGSATWAYGIVMTTLPRACPTSRWRSPAAASASG